MCLADGSCASQADVAYVARAPAGSDNPTCTKANPCTSLSTALQTSRRYIKLSGTTDAGATVSIIDQDVTLLGDPGAQLTTTKNGLLLEVRGSSHVAIYDLEVTGASGATGIGISMPAGSSGAIELHRGKVTNNVGGGISINGGSLVISQSTISGNQSNGISFSGGSLVISQSTISGNQDGGVSISGGTFAIVGNVFYNNGGINTSIGGIAISTPQNAANRLEFNSFSRNQVQDGLGAAIQCAAGAMFTARNNIMSENGTLSNLEQLGGTCKHSYSIVRPGTLPPGTSNTSSDPAFVDAAKGDLHILPGSPARRAADPTSDLTGIASRDIDGDPRVAPADLGADQAK
ncbi:MAG TPA: right-handed parallel beta-helix repeat-containing protein [Kofleriaceae bacterium]|nr:right-handed parallel beta-helix repeat-containing protein [Kofleriaceae bacterium]